MHWMQRAAHLRLLGLPVLDLALGTGLAGIAVVSTALTVDVAHPWTEMVAAVMAGSLVLRRRAPLAMAALAAGGIGLLAVLPGASTPMWSFVAVLLIAFSAGTHLTGRRAAVGVGLLVVAGYVIQFATDDNLGERLFTAPVLIGGPALAGWLLRRSRTQAEALRRLAAELAEEQERRAEAVAVAERNRIARELHDVIAHSVSVMVVQAGAAEQLLPPDAAALPYVHAVRAAGRDALAELRRSLGVLRGGGTGPHPPADDAPQPTLADLPALVAAAGATLTVDGTVPAEAASGLQLAAYRIVQEALTNARRHAPGCVVRVCAVYRPDCLTVAVQDDGGRPPVQGAGGHGLIGMSERAALYGGTVEAGPRPDGGGWRVVARLPVRAPVTAVAP